MPKQVSEVTLAGHVTRWLREDGWDIYEEVSLGYGSAGDIIAVRQPVVAAIEVKGTLSLELIGQAKRWISKAHLVYIAIPSYKRSAAFEGARWICKLLGLGILSIDPESGNVHESVRPEFRRIDAKPLIAKLHPKQQDGSVPAGSPAGLRWTPWRMTVTALTDFVRQNPGVTLAEALTKVKHHYSSPKAARATLSHQIRNGLIKTVKIEGGKLQLYPVEDPLLPPSK